MRKGFGKSDCADINGEAGGTGAGEGEILLKFTELWDEELGVHKKDAEGNDAGRNLSTELCDEGIHVCGFWKELRERENGLTGKGRSDFAIETVWVLGRRGGARTNCPAPSPAPAMENLSTEKLSFELEGIKEDRSKLVR